MLTPRSTSVFSKPSLLLDLQRHERQTLDLPARQNTLSHQEKNTQFFHSENVK
uniref:Uncharacterized protein n=1 Tax=Lepeophtheirus salmonis TaxID=72036 RepID=A0A0K2U8U1_LEPSM